MEASSKASSEQLLWKDVEDGKAKKRRCYTYQRAALLLVLVVLVLVLCVFSLRYLWRPSLGKVYDHRYKAVVDGVETDSMMEIDPSHRVVTFRMGNGSKEILEVHDFKNGITGIRFAEHQRCYIRTQTRSLPTAAEAAAEDAVLPLEEAKSVDTKVDESQVWVPAEEPVINSAFLFDSKIWEVCQELPVHWIHPAPLSEADVGNVDAPDAEGTGQRVKRDAQEHDRVNDYREVGIELDRRLDERGYCCQDCRRGTRYCRRYYEPLGGFHPWPYYYQGGRVICQIVMPCNWWVARMLGRV
ncbi:tenomodulin isoform X2 [Takifugu flavidus]|uniref:tenomodulin isoform X2 n=1 Tax=Takifugu flavidus TaxID=433684 RepID=UPI00254434E7|nr:tenomodulin isoform X2 [Takifugu flavidus]